MLNVLSLTLSGSGLPVVNVTILLLIFFFFLSLGSTSNSCVPFFSQRGISLPTGVRGCMRFQF